MAKKTKTRAEIRYHHEAAKLPCVLCSEIGMIQRAPTTIHHARTGQGMSQRASHWMVAALCRDCHQGPEGIHGDRSLLRVANLDELDLVAITTAKVFGRTGNG